MPRRRDDDPVDYVVELLRRAAPTLTALDVLRFQLEARARWGGAKHYIRTAPESRQTRAATCGIGEHARRR